MEFDMMEAIANMLLQLPNFVGLVALALVEWRNNQRLMTIIERELEDCRKRDKGA